MKTRTLSLRRERLTELTGDDLASVAGASALVCEVLGTGFIAITQLCPTWDCTGCYLTCGC